jgi:hypothetical protein
MRSEPTIHAAWRRHGPNDFGVGALSRDALAAPDGSRDLVAGAARPGEVVTVHRQHKENPR